MSPLTCPRVVRDFMPSLLPDKELASVAKTGTSLQICQNETTYFLKDDRLRA